MINRRQNFLGESEKFYHHVTEIDQTGLNRINHTKVLLQEIGM